MHKSVFGVIGLGVMGKSISLNVAEKGFLVSVYNRTDANEATIVKDFLTENNKFKNIQGFINLQEFVNSLKRPRNLFLMIKAGEVVDSVIEQLLPYLNENDIVIDGGNSHFLDTIKRFNYLAKKNIQFIGCGVSGGEEGARKGPSIMPGGTFESYQNIAPILETIAAKDKNNKPCCTYIGSDGSGHFIKMVHNGIEYAEMQLLAELYAIMATSLSNQEIASIFTNWNSTTDLSSYLLEITIEILLKKENDNYLLDKILDKAGNKGTGSWSSKAALDLGTANTMVTSAVFARYISSFKEKRIALSKLVTNKKTAKTTLDLKTLENAYRFARIINHHQGFDLMQQASLTYNWKLNLSEIARIWTNGCIIRSKFMVEAINLFKESSEILTHETIINTLNTTEVAANTLLQYGLTSRVSLATFYAAYNYWISITTKNLPANLIQAQRDYFGAHTYQLKDKPLNQFFHTNW